MDQDEDRDADRVGREVLVDQGRDQVDQAQADQVARRISKSHQFQNV